MMPRTWHGLDDCRAPWGSKESCIKSAWELKQKNAKHASRVQSTNKQMLKVKVSYAKFPFLQVFPNLLRASSELTTPSWKPIALDKAFASSYRFLASAIFPSISANSPRLCVATAQPMSHSSVLSGGVIFADTAIAFSAHARALLISAGRDIVGWPCTTGGSCWATDIERLFTIIVS